MGEVSNQSENQLVIDKEVKRYIDDDVFQQVLVMRDTIYQQTDVNVSPRKLVNMLLRQSDFQALSIKLIQQYS